jgi:hypothetical protein
MLYAVLSWLCSCLVEAVGTGADAVDDTVLERNSAAQGASNGDAIISATYPKADYLTPSRSVGFR